MSCEWYCLNHQQPTDLDQHGRCAVCGSDSVVSIEASHLKQPTQSQPCRHQAA